MRKRCRLCGSTDFRMSHFRAADIWQVICLLYPVRCNECLRRGSAFLPLALAYRRKKPAGG